MAALSVSNPFEYFTESDGTALEAGYIYIGSANQNPETNPITVYWDAALTQPAAQPIRTIGGYPSRNGSAAQLFVDVDACSITVKNRNGVLIYSTLINSLLFVSATDLASQSSGKGASLVGAQDGADGALWTTVQGFIDKILSSAGSSVVGFIAAGTGAVARTLNSKLVQDLPSAFDRLSAAKIADVQARARTLNVVTDLQAALDAWEASPGGTLTIPPGDYYLGSYGTSAVVLDCTPPRRGRISAYGARFIVETTAPNVTPFIFKFTNPDGVVFDGGEFLDLGFDAGAWVTHDRQGAGAIYLVANTACDGFTLRDARGEDLTYLVISDQRANKNLMRHVNVLDCKLKMAYYGVDLIYAAQNVDIRNLECEDVRRGFITFGARNADVDIKLKCNTGFLGANAFIALACEGETYDDTAVGGVGVIGTAANVENVRINLTVSGAEAHTGLVHFYHQQADSAGSIKNVKANVLVNNLTTAGKNVLIGDTNIFVFDHELPGGAILGATTRQFKDIELSGGVIGTISGVPVDVDSVNSSNKHTISLSPGLTAITQTLATNPLTTDVDWLSPFERPLTTLSPVGVTSAGVVTGLVTTGTYTKIGKRVFFNAQLSWTNHTGTGALRLNGLPYAANISSPSVALPVLTVSCAGLTHAAGNTLTAFIGGSGNSQILFLDEATGAQGLVNVDATVTNLYISGSYLSA